MKLLQVLTDKRLMEGIVPSSGWDATQGGLTLRRALKEARGSDPRLPGLTAWHADLSHMWGATPCIKIGFASRLDLANNYHRACSSSSSRGESQKFHQLGVTTKEMPNGARRESGSRSFVNEPVRGRAGYPVRFGGHHHLIAGRASAAADMRRGDVV